MSDGRDADKDRLWDEWVPDSALESIKCERMMKPDQTPAELARAILMSAAPMAAQSLAWLSVHAGQEAIRLKASQYLIDGVLGDKWAGAGNVDDVLMALVRQLADNPAPEDVRR